LITEGAEMLNVKMTSDTLDQNINSLEGAISLVEQKIEATHSGIDKFMLESFIIETRKVLAVLTEAKATATKSVVFDYAPVPQPEG
jgi:hypothetical protein